MVSTVSKSKAQTTKSTNIATKAGFQNFAQQSRDNFGNFIDYLNDGKAKFSFNKLPIISSEAESYYNLFYTIKNGFIYSRSFSNWGFEPSSLLYSFERFDTNSWDFEGIIVPHPHNNKFFVIVNGDNVADALSQPTLFNEFDKKNVVTISFECLSRFAENSTTEKIAKQLVNLELVVVDFTADESIELKSDERKALTAWRKKPLSTRGVCPLKPPQAGFTLLHDSWHRAATVLVYDKKNNYTIILGQDEGTYFGCELPENCETIKQAYAALTPKEAQAAGVQRQGEWFAVPVGEKEVPKVTEVLCECDEALSLPRDHEQSAHHRIHSDDIRVAKDGKIYAYNACVAHSNEDHQDLETQGWVYYVRNTAVRSFSVEGVD